MGPVAHGTIQAHLTVPAEPPVGHLAGSLGRVTLDARRILRGRRAHAHGGNEQCGEGENKQSLLHRIPSKKLTTI